VAVTRATKSEVAQEVWQALLGYFVTQRSHQLHAAQELGLTPGHVKTLFELDADQPVSMGELASVLACDASSATWLVDRLEERGLVERRAHPHDRRVKTVVLTPDGAKTKGRLVELLSVPPDDLLALDRADLDELREALRLLPPHPPFWAPATRGPDGPAAA
jgi:DNA-binding MarR family transcriptional regulator